MVYVFGAFLIYTGIRVARHNGQEVHPERNPVLRLLCRFLPMTDGYREGKFVVREGPGRERLTVTPLLAVLVAVETTDVVFAVDSSRRSSRSPTPSPSWACAPSTSCPPA